MKRQASPFLALALAAMACASASGVTVHRSFRGGFPSAVSEARLNAAESGASLGGTRVSSRTKVVAFKKVVGKVAQVDDGDTIWVEDSAGRHKVHLDKVDAPEIGQPYGEEAAQFLRDLVYGKEVEVRWQSKGQDGSLRGMVYCVHAKGVVEVNLTMVKNGFAWFHSIYDRSPVYPEAQKDARKFRRGLWAAEDPVDPVKWRRSRKPRP